jgi:hypothetical protein
MYEQLAAISDQSREWVERVRALAPIVEQWRDLADQQRRISATTLRGSPRSGPLQVVRAETIRRRST